MPMLEQIRRINLDMATGDLNFTPGPEEMREIIARQYTTKNNLLIKFRDDDIDETSDIYTKLASLAYFPKVEKVVLSGGHARPLAQALPDGYYDIRSGAETATR